MEFTQQQLYLMLGVRPEDNLEDIKIIVKNIKTQEVIKEFTVDELFEGLIKCPCDLNMVN